MIKLFTAIPAHRYLEPEMQNSISFHLNNCGYEYHYHCQRGSPNIYSQHMNMLDAFLKTDCTHYLWWDSDQTIISPDNAIQLLVEADKPIISPIIAKRNYPYIPACCNEENYLLMKKKFPPVPMDFRNETEPFEIYFCCGGIVLIKREVLELLSKQVVNPFSMFVDVDDFGKPIYCGVDFSLYHRAKNQGFSCWLDPRLIAGHIINFELTTDFYYNFLDMGILTKGKKDEKLEQPDGRTEKS